MSTNINTIQEKFNEPQTPINQLKELFTGWAVIFGKKQEDKMHEAIEGEVENGIDFELQQLNNNKRKEN